MGDEKMLSQLQKKLKFFVNDGELLEGLITMNFSESNSRRVSRNKRRTRKEFRVDAQIVDFQIKDSMLDLGSNVNIQPRKLLGNHN